MIKDSYVKKMMTILGDKCKFLTMTLGSVSQFDETAKTEQSLRSYLKEFKKKKEVNHYVFAIEQTAPTSSQRPRI